MITRADITTIHQRLLAPRLMLRRMLLNITTVESGIYRGARVSLHKVDNTLNHRPHFAYYFSVVIDGRKWTSRDWDRLLNPTKVSSRSAREFREEALTQTINYLLSLPEREAIRCPNCDEVVKRKNVRAKFCSDKCYKRYGSKAQAQRRKQGA